MHLKFLLILLAGPVFAGEFRLAPLFTEEMVVQRGRTVPVWGQAEPGAEIEVTLGPETSTVHSGADGRWRVDLAALPTGGPYRLEAKSGGRTLTVAKVLSGDVWLCSGQSNMEMALRETLGARRALADAAMRRNLRLFRIPLKWAAGPADDLGEGDTTRWSIATPEAVRDFSAVGYYFGERLAQDPALADVPIGLIGSAFGGTPVEAWIPHAGVSDLKPEDTCSIPFNAGTSAMYNAMIHPLAPAGLKGVLWYQGESNTGKPQLYGGLLGKMIAGWRDAFAEPQLPFLIVQLPAWEGRIDGRSFTWIREAEAAVAAADEHVSLAVTIDTHDGSNLHPPEKQEIGRRLALLARRDIYGEEIDAEGPIFTGVELAGDSVRVSFETHGRGLASRDPEQLRGFSVAGADGKHHFADARIDGDQVILKSDEVPEPMSVRYAWADVPDADLIAPDGLPAAPFRTDVEPPSEDDGFKPQARSYRIEKRDYQLTVDGKGRVTSLVLKGREFVSNAPGLDGATSIPIFFGGRTLGNVRRIAPGRITCSDASVSLEIDCRDDGMTWSVTNRDDGACSFRLALLPQVEATKEEGAVILRRGDATAEVEGPLELETPNENGRLLSLKVEGKSTATMTFTGW
ncbi:sialate O-acetylesterase [Luteolibacter marinus]|uniref:sialate O-acetylesterase n=1 Tax=Luteolibacter marinus TaxID=2776705 RepID=UPI001865FB06|nr:sialate O-acetylesterase [Luteolibacter marinus]